MRFAFNTIDYDLPLACESIGNKWNQHKVYRPTGYPFFHWLQTDNGAGIININDQKIKITKDQGILISPNIPHSYYPDSSKEVWETSFLTFYGQIAQQISDYVYLNDFIFFNHITTNLSEFISKNYIPFSGDSKHERLIQSTLIFEFLMIIKDQGIKNRLNSTENSMLDKITKYIKENYAQKITNEDLSQITGWSISYQNKIFFNYFGMTPLQYLTEFRLRQAKYLLTTRPDLQIQEISESVGFLDHSRFIYLFKKANYLTPKQYQSSQSKNTYY